MNASMHHDHAHHPVSCCEHATSVDMAHAQGHGPHGMQASWSAAAQVTLHCLTGCALGEWIGLALGVSLGLPAWATLTLSVTLAFVSGFALTLLPMLRSGLGIAQSLRVVWLGEAVSIAVMELVMSWIDYRMGGMAPGRSLAQPQYWIAFFSAAVSGYFAAWPVNYLLLRRNLKSCHAAMEFG